MRCFMAGMTVLLISACSSSVKQQDFEEQVITFVLSRDHQQGTYTVVQPNASVSMLGQSDAMLASMCGSVAKKIDNNERDTCAFIHRLIQINKAKPLLSVESNKAAGYVIDKSGQFADYFSEEGGGWERWYQQNPDAKCYKTVSLPAIDAKTGLVAVYLGNVCHWRHGAGHLLFLKNVDGKWMEKHRVQLWVS